MIDVLVIGSGGAGLCAAISAKEEGKKVLVVSKTHPTHSQTCQAQGGINAVLNKKEASIQKHIDDTIKSAHHLGNKITIETMCKKADETITWLDNIGVPFSKDEKGFIKQRRFGASSEIRTCYSSDYTGLKILHTLYDKAIKEEIDFLNEHMLLNIIMHEKKAIGVTVLDIKTTQVKQLLAKTIILATGGYSNLYNKFTTNSHQTTGDGISAALRAGAHLSNMEYIQFHPTAMKGNNILISESARGEGGFLVDQNEERFVDELKQRDEVARAINEKIEQGEEVYLDLRHLGVEKIEETMPQERRLAYEFLNIKLESELLPINPAAHYCMGGIKTNVSCETTLPNLYAVGECAQNGLHGANRIGGNSLLDIVTFGKIAGKHAADKSAKIDSFEEKVTVQFKNDTFFINEVYKFSNQINFYEKKEFMGKIFFKNVGLFRTDMNMKAVLQQLRQWQKEYNFMGIGDKSRSYNKNLVEFIEFGNMLELGETVVVSAISRCESRGAHYRIDHPFEVEGYKMNSIAHKIDGILSVDFEGATHE